MVLLLRSRPQGPGKLWSVSETTSRSSSTLSHTLCRRIVMVLDKLLAFPL